MSDELYNLLSFIIPSYRKIVALPDFDDFDGAEIFRGEVSINYWTKDINFMSVKHKFKPTDYKTIIAELKEMVPHYDEDDDDDDYLLDKDIEKLEIHWSRRKLIEEFLAEAE